MNKPITMSINELKFNIINSCNESGLPPAILDLVIQGIYTEIHHLAERQLEEEKKSYLEATEGQKSEDKDINLEG